MGKMRATLTALALTFSISHASAEVIKIGMIANFSGPFAVWGQQFRQSMEAFQKVNGKSIDGNEVQLIFRDNGGADRPRPPPPSAARSRRGRR